MRGAAEQGPDGEEREARGVAEQGPEGASASDRDEADASKCAWLVWRKEAERVGARLIRPIR